MKFNCKRKVEPRIVWHTWFAWFPVRVGEDDCRWLEKVERRGTFEYDSQGGYWHFEYRPLDQT